MEGCPYLFQHCSASIIELASSSLWKVKKTKEFTFCLRSHFEHTPRYFVFWKQFDCHCLLVGPQRDRLLGWATVRLDILSTFSFLRGWVLCKWLVFIFFDFCSLPRTRHTKMKDVPLLLLYSLQKYLPSSNDYSPTSPTEPWQRTSGSPPPPFWNPPPPWRWRPSSPLPHQTPPAPSRWRTSAWSPPPYGTPAPPSLDEGLHSPSKSCCMI